MELAPRVVVTRSLRLAASIALLALSRSPGIGAQNVAMPKTVPGFSYTLRVASSSPAAPPGVTGGAGSSSYVGQVIWAGAHGRVDIVEGGVDKLFSKGDYLIVDTSHVTVVHPAQREYFVVVLNGDSASRRLAALGAAAKLSDDKVRIESLGPGDTVAGIPTQRFRLTVAFNMSIDAGVIQQRLGTESVTEYWVGTVPGLPNNPLLRSNGLGGSALTGMFKTLAARVDSAAAKMGSAIALRTAATTRVVLGPGQVIETEQSSVVSDLKQTGIDQSLLMIPAGFKKIAMPN